MDGNGTHRTSVSIIGQRTYGIFIFWRPVCRCMNATSGLICNLSNGGRFKLPRLTLRCSLYEAVSGCFRQGTCRGGGGEFSISATKMHPSAWPPPDIGSGCWNCGAPAARDSVRAAPYRAVVLRRCAQMVESLGPAGAITLLHQGTMKKAKRIRLGL